MSLIPVHAVSAPPSYTPRRSGSGLGSLGVAGFAVSSGDLSDPYNRQIGVALATTVVDILAAGMTALRWIGGRHAAEQPISGADWVIWAESPSA